MFTKLAIGAAAISSSVIAVEIIQKRRKSDKKPSVVANYCADASKRGFSWVGNKLAQVSSFLTVIDMGEVSDAIKDVMGPTCHTVVSPLYTIKGYFDGVNVYDHPWIVVTGSLIITGSGYYVFTKNEDKVRNIIAMTRNKIGY